MLFQNIPHVLVYIDDILVITKGSYEKTLKGSGKSVGETTGSGNSIEY